MSQTKTTGRKADQVDSQKSQTEKAESNQTKIFFVAVLDLTWQMAIVVLVPIIGGYELDKHFNTTPLITIVGFVIAMAGTYFVIKRILNSYNHRFVNGAKGSK